MAKNTEAGIPKKSLLKLIDRYYGDMAEFARQKVMFEMGTRHAFHSLLAEAGKPYRWTLIAEQEKKINGKTIRPDGTFKDEMNLVRGYWEAKDTADKLDAEIEKKRKAGYPFNNIIFEDTQTAVLYQHGEFMLRAELSDPDKLAELVLQFFRYIEPEIEEFERAIDEFKERVPDLAEGLAKKIGEAHRGNPAFKRAFDEFFELCRGSLNPNLSQAAVDEMLIQHILTERLIRGIFDNPEFVRRNVIAAEVEKVMLAMTSHSFDRNTYLRELDRFYVAIERAARTMTDFSDKQHFLNTVYERFFQGYSVKLADTMGIVYTPQEIVDFMCASVAEVLDKEFGKKLWSDDVYFIDPCTGTGNFLVNLIRRIPKTKLEAVYKHRLFANEIMLLPYYIASLNIEHAYYEQLGKYESFEGLCFVDTLDLAEGRQTQLGFMTAKNAERVQRQRQTPITVVIGNPPYNSHQADENDNNKNRKYETIDMRVRETYTRQSTATNKNALSDAYVRFFRWAADRLEGREGIVCYVSNNGFLEGIAFDGFRKSMQAEFSGIYHFDCKGDARGSGEDRRREGGNVFSDQIRVGVGITILIRRRKPQARYVKYHAVDDYWKARRKQQNLRDLGNVAHVPWRTLRPKTDGVWLVADHAEAFASFMSLGAKSSKAATDDQSTVVATIFKLYSGGVKSNRDAVVYDFSESGLKAKVRREIEAFNAEVDRYRRAGGDVNVDDFVDYTKLKWSETLKRRVKCGDGTEFKGELIRQCTYRPFVRKWLYFDSCLVERRYRMPRIFPLEETENQVLWFKVGDCWENFTHIAKELVDLLPVSGSQCFPFYAYNDDGTNRRENITDWALKQFRQNYKSRKIDKWAIFHYVYGLLHHRGYREKFADNLKRELPRIPFAPDFWAFAKAGKKLAALHLDYEKLEPWKLEFIEAPGAPLAYRVEDKMRLSKDKLRLVVNSSLTLAGIPPAALEYRLGNRSALEWVVDQYQVSADKRSGMTSDPNRDDDPEYIVRLVGQVVRVSMETVEIVNSLPPYSTEKT